MKYIKVLSILLLLGVAGALSVHAQQGGRTPITSSNAAKVVDANNTPIPATSAPTPPQQAVIGSGNANQVVSLARLGRGRVIAVAWSPDGKTLAVAGSVGVWL